MIHLADDERDELRTTARRLLGERSSSTQVRAFLDDPVGFDRELWSTMGELGWLAIHVPEELGGMGASFSDLAVVLHELGRQLTPSPLVASAVLGAAALGRGSNRALASELVPGIASGELLVAVALSGTSGSYDPACATVGFAPGGGGIVLDGVCRFVPDAHVADRIVVSASDVAGAVVLAVVDRGQPGVTVELEPTHDRTRRLSMVTLEAVEVADDRRLCEPGEGGPLHAHLTALGAIAVLCDAVGAAEHVLEITTEYAKQRHQFGRPIGSFQAVKHHLANMLIDVEASRAAVTAAAEAVDDDDDVLHAAAVAKSFAGPACSRVTGLAIQVHAGIGFTWEHDAHLFLKRTALAEALFGSPKWHRRHLAGLLIDERRPI